MCVHLCVCVCNKQCRDLSADTKEFPVGNIIKDKVFIKEKNYKLAFGVSKIRKTKNKKI